MEKENSFRLLSFAERILKYTKENEYLIDRSITDSAWRLELSRGIIQIIEENLKKEDINFGAED